MTRGRLSCSILLPADLKKKGGVFLHVLLFPWHNESRLKTQFVCSLPHTCLLTISFLLQYFLQLLIPVTDRMLMQDWAYCSVVVRSCCGLSKYLCLLPRSGCGLICSSFCQYYTFFWWYLPLRPRFHLLKGGTRNSICHLPHWFDGLFLFFQPVPLLKMSFTSKTHPWICFVLSFKIPIIFYPLNFAGSFWSWRFQKLGRSVETLLSRETCIGHHQHRFRNLVFIREKRGIWHLSHIQSGQRLFIHPVAIKITAMLLTHEPICDSSRWLLLIGRFLVHF